MTNEKKLFIDLMNQFNNPLDNMADYTRLTKQIVKSIAKSLKTNGANITCSDLIAKCYDDAIMEDLRQEIAKAFFENANENNIRIASNISTRKLVPIFSIWNIDGKEINGYSYLCSVVRKYLENNHSIKVDLVSDFISDGNNDSDMASNKSVSDYIRIASINADIMGTYESNSIIDFFEYVKNNTKNDLYSELRTFVFYLINGFKINTIAEHMDISESRAYWLRKKIASLYMSYNPIDRKTICFAKIDIVIKKWVTIKNNNFYIDVLMDIPDTTYIRVFEHDATITVSGKTRKTIAYTDINNNVVIPKDGTRIKKYVINMSKKAMNKQFFGYSMKNAINNNGFLYITGNMVESELNKPIVINPYTPLPESKSIKDDYKKIKCEYLGQATKQIIENCKKLKERTK